MSKDSMRILSLEAKDIVIAMAADPEVGYKIPKNKDGKMSLSKFKNTLDRSLDRDKLEEVYKRKLCRNSMTFDVEGKKCTLAVINVEFNYNVKEFNDDFNTYVKYGYSYNADMLKDGAYVDENGNLIAIQTNIDINDPLPPEVLGNSFKCENGKYKVETNQNVMDTKKLREHLYINGFDVFNGEETIHYVRYKRSAGSARSGKCMFVDARLAEDMAEWDKCGLTVDEGQQIDLASWEAYIALTMSSIIDTIDIKPKNILLVDDYESLFEDTVVVVEESKKSKGKKEICASEQKVIISNCIWDGESLLDSSMFKGIYENKGMLLLRNRFFKTCAFNTNIQDWFKDKGITDTKQLKGHTKAKRIEDIKLIITPSSLKYLKFFEYQNKGKSEKDKQKKFKEYKGPFEQWLKNIDSTFGIVKYEKKPPFFEGELVQSHYQLLNTLKISWDEMAEILEPSKKYLEAIRSDPVVLRYHIHHNINDNKEFEDEESYQSLYDIIYDLLETNDKFAETELYNDFRCTINESFIKKLREGRILLNGNYSTLLCNGIELLKQAIGEFDGKSVIPKGTVCTTRFEPGKEILCVRSPHITMGNILLAENIGWSGEDEEGREQIYKYFNLTEEIIYITAIGDNILNRLNGADMDSDNMLITDNEYLINAAKKNYDKFKVPHNGIEASKKERYYRAKDKADLDNLLGTSSKKVGEVVNLSQLLNSRYWVRESFNESEEMLKKNYYDICKLAVFSGIEIDKAKKEFNVKSSDITNDLKKEHSYVDGDGITYKPKFFEALDGKNGELKKSVKYTYFKTAMDFLLFAIDDIEEIDLRRNFTPLTDVLTAPPVIKSKSGSYTKEFEKYIGIIEKCREDILKERNSYYNSLRNGRHLSKEEAKEKENEMWKTIDKLKSDCISKLDGLRSERVLYQILCELDKIKNVKGRPHRKFMFEMLFSTSKGRFRELIAKSKKTMYELKQDPDGEEEYYGIPFSRKEIVRYCGFQFQNE